MMLWYKSKSNCYIMIDNKAVRPGEEFCVQEFGNKEVLKRVIRLADMGLIEKVPSFQEKTKNLFFWSKPAMKLDGSDDTFVTGDGAASPPNESVGEKAIDIDRWDFI